MKHANRKVILLVIKICAHSASVFLSEEGSAVKIENELVSRAAMRISRTVLVVNSSPNLETSHSRALSHHFTNALEARYPRQYTLLHRDLAINPVPHIQHDTLEVIAKNTTTTPQARALAMLSDTLIKEVEDSHAIIISTPMHNFTTPASLKAYFDLIMRAGKTFKYTSEGPQGLLFDRPILLISCSGGYYHRTNSDFLTPYVSRVFNFMGMTNLKSIAAEGMAMDDKKELSLAHARGNLEQSIEWFHTSENTRAHSKN